MKIAISIYFISCACCTQACGGGLRPHRRLVTHLWVTIITSWAPTKLCGIQNCCLDKGNRRTCRSDLSSRRGTMQAGHDSAKQQATFKAVEYENGVKALKVLFICMIEDNSDLKLGLARKWRCRCLTWTDQYHDLRRRSLVLATDRLSAGLWISNRSIAVY